MYIKGSSTSRMSILVQKQAYDINNIIRNPDTEINGKVVIPQDMETITRSCYFVITNDPRSGLDFIPPGKKILVQLYKLNDVKHASKILHVMRLE